MAAEFSEVLILGSMDGATRRDRDLQHTQTSFRHLWPASSPPCELGSRLTAFCPPHLSSAPSSPSTAWPLIPAGGFARRLLRALSDAKPQFPFGALLLYVIEGDNHGDAMDMASAVVHVLNLATKGLFLDRNSPYQPNVPDHGLGKG